MVMAHNAVTLIFVLLMVAKGQAQQASQQDELPPVCYSKSICCLSVNGVIMFSDCSLNQWGFTFEYAKQFCIARGGQIFAPQSSVERGAFSKFLDFISNKNAIFHFWLPMKFEAATSQWTWDQATDVSIPNQEYEHFVAEEVGDIGTKVCAVVDAVAGQGSSNEIKFTPTSCTAERGVVCHFPFTY